MRAANKLKGVCLFTAASSTGIDRNPLLDPGALSLSLRGEERTAFGSGSFWPQANRRNEGIKLGLLNPLCLSGCNAGAHRYAGIHELPETFVRRRVATPKPAGGPSCPSGRRPCRPGNGTGRRRIPSRRPTRLMRRAPLNPSPTKLLTRCLPKTSWRFRAIRRKQQIQHLFHQGLSRAPAVESHSLNVKAYAREPSPQKPVNPAWLYPTRPGVTAVLSFAELAPLGG